MVVVVVVVVVVVDKVCERARIQRVRHKLYRRRFAGS